MCIIVNKPAGKIVKDSTWDNCISEHPDGVGVAHLVDKQLIVKKGMWSLKEFLAYIEPIKDQQLLVHFRTASPNTPVNEANCHPYYCESDQIVLEGTETPRFQFAIVHNGRINWRTTKDQSDTSCFVEDMLAPTLSGDPWFFSARRGVLWTTRCVNQVTTDNNKLVIMSYDLKEDKLTTYTVNEPAGTIEDGVWYSNTTFRWPKKSTYVGTVGYGAGYGSEDFALSRQDTDYSTAMLGNYSRKLRSVKGAKDYATEFRIWPDWHRPDDKGWYWSFTEDVFIHSVSGHKQPLLSYRAAPYGPNGNPAHHVPPCSPEVLMLQKGGVGALLLNKALSDPDGKVESKENKQIIVLPGKAADTTVEVTVVQPKEEAKEDKKLCIADLALSKPEMNNLIALANELLEEGGLSKKERKVITVAEKLMLLVEAVKDTYIQWATIDDEEALGLIAEQLVEGKFPKEEFLMTAAINPPIN